MQRLKRYDTTHSCGGNYFEFWACFSIINSHWSEFPFNAPWNVKNLICFHKYMHFNGIYACTKAYGNGHKVQLYTQVIVFLQYPLNE